MRTFLNFTLAILLLIAFVGSGVFFLTVSKDLKLERVESNSTGSTSTSTSESEEN